MPDLSRAFDSRSWVDAFIAASPPAVASDLQVLREVALQVYEEIGREVHPRDAAEAIAKEMRSRMNYLSRPS